MNSQASRLKAGRGGIIRGREKLFEPFPWLKSLCGGSISNRPAAKAVPYKASRALQRIDSCRAGSMTGPVFCAYAPIAFDPILLSLS
jgi:hypothetical protein